MVGNDGHEGGNKVDVYILIPIPIPNLKSHVLTIPIPSQCGDFFVKMGTCSGNTNGASLFVISIW